MVSRSHGNLASVNVPHVGEDDVSESHSGLSSRNKKQKRPESTASECVNPVECVAAVAAAVAAVAGSVLIDIRDIHTSHQGDQAVCRLRSGPALPTRCRPTPPSPQKGVTGDYGIPPED